jgi:hypothetical protein
MNIPALFLTIVNLCAGGPQAADSTSLSDVIVRETVGYADCLNERPTPGPLLVDFESFQKKLDRANVKGLTTAKLLRFAHRQNSRIVDASAALRRDSYQRPISVLDDGLLVRLWSVESTGDSASIQFMITFRFGGSSQVGSELIQVDLARSNGTWKRVGRKTILQS